MKEKLNAVVEWENVNMPLSVATDDGLRSIISHFYLLWLQIRKIFQCRLIGKIKFLETYFSHFIFFIGKL